MQFPAGARVTGSNCQAWAIPRLKLGMGDLETRYLGFKATRKKITKEKWKLEMVD
jgi:hypothetical protein